MKPTRDPSKSGMIFIFITLLIDVIGFGLVIPISPRLVQELAHVSVSDSSLPYTELLTLYGLMQFVFAPILGSLSDKYGRRPILLVALGCGAIDYAFMALAPSLAWLFVGRTISGIAGASFTAATAYIADISTPEKRAQNFGMIGAAFGIGFVIGPMIGGWLGQYGLRIPFWAAFALNVANFLYGYFVVPESLPLDRRRNFRLRDATTVGSVKLLLRYPATVFLALGFLLSGLAQQFLQSVWILYTQYRFGWTIRENGIGLGLVGLCVGIVQAVLSRRIIPKFGEANSLVFGSIVTALGFYLYGIAFASWMMYGTIVVWCLGAVANPAGQAILSKAYGDDEQGAVQGAAMSIQSICMVVGPLIAGGIFKFSTAEHLAVKMPGMVFFAASGLSAMGALFSFLAVRRPEVSRQPEAA